MSRHTGIELTEADVPPDRREAWRAAKAPTIRQPGEMRPFAVDFFGAKE